MTVDSLQVRNFVPEPTRVEGCVFDAKWSEQVKFLRMFALLQLVVWFPTFIGPTVLNGLVVTAILVGFANSANPNLSQLVLLNPLLLGASTMLINWLGKQFHFPLLGISPICGSLYILVAGRNYSRTGQFLYSLMASSVIIAAVGIATNQPVETTRWQELINFALTLYLVTDLASITLRRKPTEVMAASVDIFRDIFNWIPWLFKFAKHVKELRQAK